MRCSILLVLLVGCGSVREGLPAPVDAAVARDAPRAPEPWCRPLSENPACVGACVGLQAACASGYTAGCFGVGSRWERTVDGSCAIRNAWGAQCDEASGAVVCDTGYPGCVVNDYVLGCPE